MYHERKAWKDDHLCYFPCLDLFFFSNPANNRSSQISFRLNLMNRISFFEKRNDCRVLDGRCGLLYSLCTVPVPLLLQPLLCLGCAFFYSFHSLLFYFFFSFSTYKKKEYSNTMKRLKKQKSMEKQE